ncbi:MAG: phospho-N-acetylmuramoyl-pentapeptide-transferase [Verrucomicrobiota bacterium]
MIKLLIDYLNIGPDDVPFNLLRYITFRSGAAAMITFVVSVLIGNWVIRKLISLKVGQPIRTADEVHKLAELHGQKAGTPTMGGVLILGTFVLAILLFGDLQNPFVFAVAFVTISLGALGFVDDYAKVVKKNSDGLSARWKLIIQVLVSGSVGAFLFFYPDPEVRDVISKIYLPSVKEPILDLGVFCIPFFVLVIVGASNAVNLTDGLDGLATGCTITTAGAFAMLCYLAGRPDFAAYLDIPHLSYSSELMVLAFALVGACLGFLWFNCHPAKVFMGDTGSLAIGGCLAMFAICCKQEMVLVIIGGVFVMEAGSVILQVASFKIRKKRIFRMSPIHHHFELKGWKESQVITRFWILSIIFAFVGLATLKVR